MVSFNVSILSGLIGLLILVAADWLLGILTAFRTNTFSWTYLYHQAAAQALPLGFIAVVGVLQALSVNGAPVASGALTGFFAASSATYAVKLIADIVSKLSAVLGPVAPPPVVAVTPVPTVPLGGV